MEISGKERAEQVAFGKGLGQEAVTHPHRFEAEVSHALNPCVPPCAAAFLRQA